mmetsp:Transcript_28649/g.75880  ORF Transcript_28649/g.75880 Transcript_28649/m.75880 type:complete len:278 (+) Transcript_28649:400-1233(+)
MFAILVHLAGRQLLLQLLRPLVQLAPPLPVGEAGEHLGPQRLVLLQERLHVLAVLLGRHREEPPGDRLQLDLARRDVGLRGPREGLQDLRARVRHRQQELGVHRDRPQRVLQHEDAAVVEVLLLVHVGDEGARLLLLEALALVGAVDLPLLCHVAAQEARDVLLQLRELEGVELELDLSVALLAVVQLEDRGARAAVHGEGQGALEAALNAIAARHVDSQTQLRVDAQVPVDQQLGLLRALQRAVAAVSLCVEGDDNQVAGLLNVGDLDRVAVQGAL